MIHMLASQPMHPESVPINLLVQVRSMVRRSAGRQEMTDETQALCFLAGANSIFSGDRLLTTANPGEARDRRLFDRLGLVPMTG